MSNFFSGPKSRPLLIETLFLIAWCLPFQKPCRRLTCYFQTLFFLFLGPRLGRFPAPVLRCGKGTSFLQMGCVQKCGVLLDPNHKNRLCNDFRLYVRKKLYILFQPSYIYDFVCYSSYPMIISPGLMNICSLVEGMNEMGLLLILLTGHKHPVKWLFTVLSHQK